VGFFLGLYRSTVTFFLALHRSIVDPQFYIEVLEYRRFQILLFLIQLLVLISVLGALAQCYYLIDSNRGIPAQIESAFNGMEIRNGILDPKAQTPIVPATYLVMPMLDQLSGFQNYFSSDNDSMVVIDTAQTRNYVVKVPAIVMAKEKVVFIFNKKNNFEIPYKTLLFGEESLRLRAVEVKQFLDKKWGILFFTMFVAGMFQNTVSLFFSIFFLAIAAFFFRLEKGNAFTKFLRAASFSISPMAIGSVLIAISGVKIIWGWHLLIFICTVVLFRGLIAIGKSASTDESGEI
jgi:hypothetical protein